MPLRYKNRFGRVNQKIHLGEFHVDRRNFFTGEIEYWVDDEDFYAPNFGLLNVFFGVTVASMAGIRGIGCTGVDRKFDSERSLAIYTYHYEGWIQSSQGSPNEFELEITMQQEDIQTHPNFEEIDKVFGPWNVLDHTWPRVPPVDTTTKGLAAASDPTVRPTNPMFGITSYLVPSTIYRRTRTSMDIGDTTMDDIGTIIDEPPQIGIAFPILDQWIHNQTIRNWLKLAPKIRKHGDALSITEEWWLSGPRGWEPLVYSKEALKGQFQINP